MSLRLDTAKNDGMQRQARLGAAELLQHEVRESRIALLDTDGVLQTLVVTEHELPWMTLKVICVSA
jgi:hypothetical protein